MEDNLKKKVKPLSTYQQDYVKGIKYHQKNSYVCIYACVLEY